MGGVAYLLEDALYIGNVRTVKAAGDVVMANEGVLVLNKTVGQATQVTLRGTPPAGWFVMICDDKGDAASNNITVIPDGVSATTINGAGSFVMAENNAVLTLHFNGVEWNVVAYYNSLSDTQLNYLSGVTPGTALANKALVLDANKAISTVTTLGVTNLNLGGTLTTANGALVAGNTGNGGLTLMTAPNQPFALWGGIPLARLSSFGELVGLNGNAGNAVNAANMNSNGNLGNTNLSFNDLVKAVKQLTGIR